MLKLIVREFEAHSSLGLGERHHEPLRATYRKMMVSHPSIEKHWALDLFVKAMNDTLGPEGIVPSVLEFGKYPQVFTTSESRPPPPFVTERAIIADTTRSEREKQMATLKQKRGMHHAVPPAADRSHQPGDQVLVRREEIIANRIGE